jgi:hypothetical protein
MNIKVLAGVPFHKMMTFTPSLHRGGFCLFARRSFAL